MLRNAANDAAVVDGIAAIATNRGARPFALPEPWHPAQVPAASRSPAARIASVLSEGERRERGQKRAA